MSNENKCPNCNKSNSIVLRVVLVDIEGPFDSDLRTSFEDFKLDNTLRVDFYPVNDSYRLSEESVKFRLLCSSCNITSSPSSENELMKEILSKFLITNPDLNNELRAHIPKLEVASITGKLVVSVLKVSDFPKFARPLDFAFYIARIFRFNPILKNFIQTNFEDTGNDYKGLEKQLQSMWFEKFSPEVFKTFDSDSVRAAKSTVNIIKRIKQTDRDKDYR